MKVPERSLWWKEVIDTMGLPDAAQGFAWVDFPIIRKDTEGWRKDPRVSVWPSGVPATRDEQDVVINEFWHHGTIGAMRDAKIVVAEAEQWEEFGEAALPPDSIRLPFMPLWIELSRPVGAALSEGGEGYSGILLMKVPTRAVLESTGEQIAAGDFLYIIGFGKRRSLTVWRQELTKDGAVLGRLIEDVRAYKSEETMSLNRPFYRSLFGFLHMMVSPVTTLELGGEYPAPLNKKRVKAGKIPVPGWFKVVWVDKVRIDRPHRTDTGRHVSVRYWVRGFWRRLTKGRDGVPLDEPRSVWVRPHMRGLANDIVGSSLWKMRSNDGKAGSAGLVDQPR